ncbi:DNA-3-methyladenine glycosylase [Mycobacterium sp. CBMA293]|uniref:DNA-3-methyladenine glycosylase n=1 Tax=unclassified Mycolicibacterium TaxID=2636767 RepID=UPI0012DCFBF2|nr:MULTISPECIES: DNA-3-methyladenine glycosylase [unclassified Mycolicibacterium]MUL45117.1 DNA-3-methyladenine glycosylase [Mycolicibacterium sp. CBMA 360]MUL56634.1 DNA-3-methyladenine glycosylase [Mycolicibacterium sp. CBMA 335]MUL69673.1 DNA-3-methyladenine glycosylase [Mycolicibacterium sp. CBMA 311]MUL91721.1 DNA-3-methyladenine glycosylase [Mycolicibacterium sp. CBMA 230]MUM05458.1 3-methyladenine DNA glycosylase [Mycolicibacterium sp. CBMA 213]
MSVDQLSVDPVTAARRLLGATLYGRGVIATLVEVEAYGGPPSGPWPDAAAHSFRGPTARSAVMFGSAGRLYTYRSHGIHVCANVVCAGDGVAGAVLLRAARIVDGCGVAEARRRPGIAQAAAARGPGNLCEALGITLADNGIDLLDRLSPVRLELTTPQAGTAGPRVGVSQAADRPWRFWLSDTPEVSAYRRSPRAPKPGDSD